MPDNQTVVTPARFAAGLTYQQFLDQAKVNKDKFEQYYQSAHVTAADAAFFKKMAALPNGPQKILVVGEDWCPDVFRGLPVIVRIAEASGMELRVFPKGQNLDIMNEFLNQGQFQSIPVVVFYTRDVRYICHWIERPAAADADILRHKEQVRKEMPALGQNDFLLEVRKHTGPLYPAWQVETVKDIRQLLAKTLGVK